MSLFGKLMTRQLSQPSRFVGRLYLAPLWNRRNRALNDTAFEALHPSTEDRVLEVGFGGGYLLGRLTAAVTDGFVAGVDASPEMVAYCCRRYRKLVATGKLELACAPAEKLPYPAGRFTAVCSVNSIFYWQDAPAALREFQRVLRPWGRVILCFTCRDSLAGRGLDQQRVTLYEADDVEALLKKAGFKDITITRTSDPHRNYACLTARK